MTRAARLPNTPSQRWAQVNGACLSGRRRLGKRSLAEYWKVCPNNRLHDLLWIVTHLKVPYISGELEGERFGRQQRYEKALVDAFYRGKGRWKGQHVRSGLADVVHQHNVYFPMWLF